MHSSMLYRSLALLIVFSLASSGSVANAALLLYSTTLSGAAESPPNASPGTGSVLVTIDDVLQTMRVQASFTGLTGNTTAAHIHGMTAAPGTGTAGVITTTPSFVGFPAGVTSGSMDQTYDLTLASTYNATFVTAQGGVNGARLALLNGLTSGTTYFNVHTTTFGGGEIRGFLTAVPEPSSLLVIGTVAAGAAWRVRRSRRKNGQGAPKNAL